MKPNNKTRSNHQSKLNQTACASLVVAINQQRQHNSSTDERGFRKQVMFILDLPPEVISLILIRLPVKTLSILKCVNNYFSRFVSCRKFIRDHLEFSTKDASMSGCKIMLEGDSNSELKIASIPLFCHESPVDFVNLDYPEMDLENTYWLVGSCNGLVVVMVNRQHFFLWNPTIRKHEKLPSIGMMKQTQLYCGFGFDASNDDYKVVALCTFGSQDSKSKTDVSYVVNVYSLKKNSWTRIPDFTGGKFDEAFAKLACGKLYWSSHRGNVVSFDVEREVFETLELPNYGEGFMFMMSSVLGGSFCLCYDYDKHVDVWVMKEHGDKLFWTKMFTVTGYGNFIFPRLYFILPNGKVLSNCGVFHIYNPKDNSWRPTEIYFRNDPLIYVESLVSPCCN